MGFTSSVSGSWVEKARSTQKAGVRLSGLGLRREWLLGGMWFAELTMFQQEGVVVVAWPWIS